MAEHAARAFALELDRAGTDLTHATHRLRCAFAELAEEERANDNGGGASGRDGGDAERSNLPDPLLLLRRLSKLEAALPGLKEQSRDLAARRPALVRETCKALKRNAHEIQTLAARTGISDESVDSGSSRNDAEEWSEVVAQVSEQQRKHTIRANSSSLATDGGANPSKTASSTDAQLLPDNGDEDEEAAWASSVVAAGATRRRQQGASTPALFSVARSDAHCGAVPPRQTKDALISTGDYARRSGTL